MASGNHLVFLLGSGVSVPAGYPTVSDITARMRSGAGAVETPHGNFDFQPESGGGPPPSDLAGHAIEFIRRVESLCQRVGEGPHTPNYEETLYLVVQLRDSLLGEIENPALEPLVRLLQTELRIPIGTGFVQPGDRDSLLGLANLACNYIQDLVWRLLSREPSRVSHLDFIPAARMDNPTLVVATLNHDLLIERAAMASQVHLETGFDPLVRGFGHWNPSRFASGETWLLKLHGSINWFWFHDRDAQEMLRFGMTDGSPFTARNERGRALLPFPVRPFFLAGTNNKIVDYSMTQIASDLQCRWRDALRQTNRLVVVGYGFGDKAINGHLVDWIELTEDPIMLIVHRNEARLVERARPVIRHNWQEWKDRRRLKVLEKAIEDASWEEMKALL